MTKPLILLMCLLATVGQKTSVNPNGYVSGTAVYINEADNKFLSNATTVVVTLKHNETKKSITTDENGDFNVSLSNGAYCIESVKDMNNGALRLASRQEKCFTVKDGKTTRFDIMLLK